MSALRSVSRALMLSSLESELDSRLALVDRFGGSRYNGTVKLEPAAFASGAAGGAAAGTAAAADDDDEEDDEPAATSWPAAGARFFAFLICKGAGRRDSEVSQSMGPGRDPPRDPPGRWARRARTYNGDATDQVDGTAIGQRHARLRGPPHLRTAFPHLHRRRDRPHGSTPAIAPTRPPTSCTSP